MAERGSENLSVTCNCGGGVGVPRNLARSAAVAWRLLVLGALAYSILWLLNQVLVIALPLFIAMLVAAALIPVVQWLQARGVNRLLATIVVVLSVYASLFLIVFYLGEAISGQFGQVGDRFKEGVGELQRMILDGPLGVTENQLDRFVSSTLDQLRNRIGGARSAAVAGAVTALEVVAGLLLTLVLAFFLVKDGDRIIAWFLKHVPQEHSETYRAVGRRAWGTLGGYLRGTIVIATVDAIGIGLGLWAVGVPLILPLMALTFFGAFFPIIGATVAGLVAVLVALVSGGPTDALLVGAVVLAVQQFDSNFLEPVVMARAVPLHPVVILAVITAGFAVAGLVGAFVAVPLAAVASAVGNELRERRVILPGVEGVEPEPPS